MAKTDPLLKIDYKPNTSSRVTTSVGGGSTISVDTSLFVLRDGTQAMLGNFDVGGFSITNINLIDGVDISSFYSSYTSHIANVNAHHNQVHEIISSDHTASGLTAGNVIRASDATTFTFAQLQHNDLGGITANQHHNQVHNIIGSDHTVTGSAFDLIGLSATNTLAIVTPSSNVSAPLERILKSNSSGGLQLASLTVPLINTASGDITLNPAGNIVLDAGGTGTLPGGTILEDLGYYNRKWRTIYAAELYVETLVAQDVMATIGGRIIVAPTTTLIADASNVATTIDVKHNFLTTNDYIILQTAPGGIAQTEVMRITSTPTTITGGYRYSVTRNLDGSGANSWLSGDAVVELGQGYIDLTSTSTVLNSKIGPTITIYDRNSTSTWNSLIPTVSIGNLNGFVGYSTDTNGFATGNNLTLSATTGFIGATIDRTNGLRLFNTPFSMYNGATERIHIAAHNDIWIGVSSADKRLEWNGSTLTVRGAIIVQAGSSGIGTFSDAGALATQSNLDGVPDGTTYRRTTLNEKTGAGRAYSALDSNNSLVTRVDPATAWGANPGAGLTGLLLGSDYFGYWDGTALSWRTFLDNQGRFYFRGASGARLVWDGTRLFGGTSESFSSSTAQWYIDSSNGRLVAGQGQFAITVNGMNLSYYGNYNSVDYGSYSRFRWYYTGSTESGLLAQMYLQTSWDYTYATTVPFESRVKELLLISNDANFVGFTIRNNTGSSIFSVTGNRIYSNQPLDLFGTSTNTLAGGLEVGGTIGYSWNTPTFSGSWANFGTPNTAVQYKRFGSLISIKGIIRANASIAANSVMFTLPSGYRPDANRSFICYCRTGGGATKNYTRVYINNVGGVYSDEAFVNNDWISLEITFIT